MALERERDRESRVVLEAFQPRIESNSNKYDIFSSSKTPKRERKENKTYILATTKRITEKLEIRDISKKVESTIYK